ncbi:bifunctional serine/threonine-protein kinase/formylglycine-generating enzyme family protein [Candidatus Magnetomonas plexicatena]|uniref:bifunctional serine/threonine-protein kinase/formylglycine-generating enzyme family protein n=1 Tax=Candidatus Magnetomonas plexicatena TaxID=2552947 RepID=UPI001C776E81|nr:SUMF1/EgtB/PvdO family nonheme iron enzyme [Nitrospirales bacterium LBB_01]
MIKAVQEYYDDKPTCWVVEGPTVSLDTGVNPEIHTSKKTPLFKDSRYDVRRKLGTGGQGTVYLVWDNVVEKPFAIKVLPAAYLNNRVNFARFQDEIKIPQRIKHPLIASIHDAVELKDGSFGIKMEFIGGTDLLSWIADVVRPDRFKAADDVLTVLINLSEALAAAHENGVIHRDLKPSNVILKDGNPAHPILLDFGLAFLSGEGLKQRAAGTFAYMAPEQVHDNAELDGKADLFALGVIVYKMFTGFLPPCSLKDFEKTLTVPSIPIRDIEPIFKYNPRVPASLDYLIRSLLAHDPSERFGGAAELVRELRTIKLISPDDIVFRDNPVHDVINSIDFIVIPSGSFDIGGAEKGCSQCEKPMRRVTLNTYEISVHPITNAIYREFLKHSGFPKPPWIDDTEFGRDNCPVVGVTWDEAMACALWLNGSLPTEAQWEKAAKGTERRIYPWGNEYAAFKANVEGCQKTTTPVGAFKDGKSFYGVLDMAGNVREWCFDWYNPEAYTYLTSGNRDPKGPQTGTEKSLRGGGYRSLHYEARCSFRGHRDKDKREPDIGFRVVRVKVGV